MELQYQGHWAKIWYSPLTSTFYGELLQVEGLWCFQASELCDAIQAMQETVNAFLEWMTTDCGSV